MGEQIKSYLNGGSVLTQEDVDRLSNASRESMVSFAIPDGVISIGDDAFDGCDQLTATVQPGSYAETYCKQNNIQYTFGA